MALNQLVLDTSAYSGALRGNPSLVTLLQQADRIVLPVIAMGELLAGFAGGTQGRKNRQGLQQFIASSRVYIHGLTAATAERYAIIVSTLRQQGTPIPTNDIWIAACAMELGLPVLTMDRDFQRVTQIASELVLP